ncbi:hypothetical protein ACWDTG_25505 [Rhodococcus zopfii]
MSLYLCTELSATKWLVDQGLPWYQLAGRGPSGYPRYARVRFIPDPRFSGQKSIDFDFDSEIPPEKVQVGIALDILAHHTSTPDECYFCMWDGWSSTEVHDDVPKFRIPNRDYWLFRGTLADYADWNVSDPARWPYGDSPAPAFIWPADHAWCVTNDVDDHYATIGATEKAIDQIVNDTRIDAVVDNLEHDPPYWD